MNIDGALMIFYPDDVRSKMMIVEMVTFYGKSFVLRGEQRESTLSFEFHSTAVPTLEFGY